ncbi:MAG TPA: CRTAC1 family protein [Planctomycetota bacterium]|nr:CRTAC1 family protein [Planctomycetota bacterium]
MYGHSASPARGWGSALAAALAACSGNSEAAGPAAGSGGGRPAASFTDVTADAGIAALPDRGTGDYFMPESLAAGCALFDCDLDGDLDVYLVNGFRAADGSTVTPQGANRLWIQEERLRFRDATESSGAGDRGYGMGVAVGDASGDGYPDLYVTNYGPDTFLASRGDGTFEDRTGASGLGQPAWGSSAGFFDLDLDGDLDLYVANYLDYLHTRPSTDRAGRPEYAGPHSFEGVPDCLYRNLGGGRFEDISASSGIANARSKGLGVIFLDLDGDGRTDVYVANDAQPNHAWINAGDGTFRERARELGLAVSASGAAQASMGLAAGDLDGDGRLELFATNLVQETNVLYREPSPGRWQDATLGSGLGPPSLDRTGFGTAFADLELDGDLDVLVANGRVLRTVSDPRARIRAHWSPYAEPDQVLVNDGRGRFREVPAGDFTREVRVSRGLAVGDVDGDGALDVLLTCADGHVALLRNGSERAGRWLVARVVEGSLPRDAIGARVEVRAGGRSHVRLVQPASSYLSSSDPRVHFGLGQVQAIEEVLVRWPDGALERFDGVELDRACTLERGKGR